MGFDKNEFEEITDFLPEGIIKGYKYAGCSCKVMEVTPELSSILTEGISENYTSADFRKFAESADCDYLLLFWHRQEEIRLMSYSRRKDVRALEFLDYIITDFGLAKGNSESAFGRISSAVLSVEAFGEGMVEAVDYLLQMVDNYFKICEWIYAKEYSEKNRALIEEMKVFRKRRVPWAYVKTTELVQEGEKIRIRSLENESGLEIEAKDDAYIMIGCRGEVYSITAEKFDSTYDTTEEHLDVFERMLDFLPEVMILSDNSFVTIDELARICYPKQKPVIHARLLENRTKVFADTDSDDYFLGRPGDYMAVRLDDYSDIYVIQKDVFMKTYEEV